MTIEPTGTGPAKHILVVDDDADIRATLSDFLADEGYQVTAVANGRDALSHLRQNSSTSVILLDLMMPVMDGFEFRVEQKLDASIAGIPVVVMTARGRLGPGAIDVNEIIAKPFKFGELRRAIERAERPAQ